MSRLQALTEVLGQSKMLGNVNGRELEREKSCQGHSEKRLNAAPSVLTHVEGKSHEIVLLSGRIIRLR